LPSNGTPGMKDVAAAAGVSVGTVSNVLNRPELVSEATRNRVRQAIATLGFVRNETARQLRAGRSRTIAYVVLDVANPFFSDVARGVEDAARVEGVAVYLCNSNQNAAREEEYLERLREQRVQGVLITPIDPTGAWLADLPAQGTPTVLVDCHATDGAHCSVAVDDVLGGELALTHLIELGHERIAFVGGPASVPQVADRRAGARRALRAAGRRVDSLVELSTDALNVAEGRRAGERILAMPDRPTAAFCANDLLALGLLQAMTHGGLDVPGDLAVVGYDDIEFAEAAAVPLTSVRQPREQLGATAARLLFEEAAEDPAHTHQQIRFSPELVVRESTRVDTG
jgi:LacI family transcriptional regulator, galactose operon repressor